MEKKYETKIKDYTKDIEQNINQEAVLQTIKKCKETFVQACAADNTGYGRA